jgi:uncharacterized protein
MFRFILLLIILIAAGGAGTWFLTDQVDKFSSAKIPNDIHNLLSRAKAGDVDAEFRLGEAYRLGSGVEKDIPQAFRWYGRAAEKGHVVAQYNLGLIYETGEGIKKNMVRAAEWYRLAASLGRLPEAQFAMGLLYFHGRGVQQDYVEAFNYYKKAAEQGHHVAQHVLGAMYQEGWAVEKDLIQAYKWYTLAMPGREAAIAVNRIYDPVRARKHLVKKMNQFQIGRGKKLAKEWRKSR